MATLVTRSGKGSPLTHAEVDANFTNLNTDKLELSGGTMTGNLSFGDNDKAIFGDGSDLQIYHDGSQSYIDDVGTGRLNIRANDRLYLRDTNDSVYAVFYSGAGSFINHNGNTKLATTSTGIDVTGTVTADGLTATGGGSDVVVRIDTEVADKSDWRIRASDSGSEGELYIEDFAGAQWTPAIKFTHGGDISFYEDTGTTAKFFWDASAESLGIGTSSPSYTIHTKSSSGGVGLIESTSSNSDLYFKDSGTTYNYSNGIGSVGNALRFRSGDGSERMRITSSGSVGIGTTSPAIAAGGGNPELTISGTVSYFNLQGNRTAGAGNTTGQITSFNNSTAISRLATVLDSGTTDGAMLFSTASSGSLAERMRIDSSGNVGIGTSSPSEAIDVLGGKIKATNGANTVYQLISADNNGGVLQTGSNAMRFFTSGSESMRIDSSGNLLVGTTTTNTQSSSGGTNTGTWINSAGIVNVGSNSNAAAYLNRQSTDGDIAVFRKDGTTVGSIGTDGALNIGSTNTGIKFGTSAVWATTGGSTNSNGAKDLGASTVRWKDLYLSGGVYLGGTGSANHLDDYEEGTWTAELNIPSGSVTYNNTSGVYTKVGNIVHVSAWIYISALSSPSGTLTITMPFTNQGNVRQGQVFVQNRWTGITGLLGGWMSNSSTTLNLVQIEDGTMGSAVTGSNLLANGELYINYSYQV